MIHRFLNLYCYRTVPGPPICNWLESVGKVGFASSDASRSDNWIYRSIGRRRFSLFGLDIWKQQNHKWFIFVANFELVSLPVKAFVVMNSLRFRHLFAFNWFKITYNFTSCVCLVELKKCIHTSIVFQSLLKLALHGFSLPIYQSRVILLLNDVSMYCSCMHQQPMTNSSSRWLPFTHSIIIPNTQQHMKWKAIWNESKLHEIWIEGGTSIFIREIHSYADECITKQRLSHRSCPSYVYHSRYAFAFLLILNDIREDVYITYQAMLLWF